MANLLYYWDGTTWQQVAYGAGGGGTVGPVGPQGPAGTDGHSVEVYGPQLEPPPAPAKGDVWLAAPPAVAVADPNSNVVPKVVPVTKLGSRITWRPDRYPSITKRR